MKHIGISFLDLSRRLFRGRARFAIALDFDNNNTLTLIP